MSYTVYPEILAVQKYGDFTPNSFFYIGGILIWQRIYESRMRVTSTIARKMLAYFNFDDSNIDRQIAKFTGYAVYKYNYICSLFCTSPQTLKKVALDG